MYKSVFQSCTCEEVNYMGPQREGKGVSSLSWSIQKP